jgi:hypothetical protein
LNWLRGWWGRGGVGVGGGWGGGGVELDGTGKISKFTASRAATIGDP